MWNFDKYFHLNKKGKEKQPPESEPVVEIVPAVSQPEEPISLSEAVYLSELQGDPLEVWRRWAGEERPPLLSLASGIEPEKLQMKAEDLEKEKRRVADRLAQDAKSRLQEIRAAEEKSTDGKLAPKCCCYVSQNKLVAWIFVFPPVGDEEKITSAQVGAAMAQAGVESGVDAQAVVKVLQKAHYFELIPAAFGNPPVESKDGVIREHFPRELEPEVMVDENGNADYRSASYVQNVDKGDIICDIEPPVPGQNGMGVDGKVIAAASASPAKIPQGSNTQLSEDGLHLIATQTGYLEYAGGAFHVRPVLEIRTDVDYSTGNIDFVGDVHIHGDVRENFTVQAKGTIIIDGLVEAAKIIAGGDLLISSGVVGDDRAALYSAGNVRAKYLENCIVYSGRRVYSDCIVASQIFCDDAVIVTSGRGSIIGGNLTANNAVQAKMIGARSGRQTELRLGEMPYAKLKLESIEEELVQTQEEKRSLEIQLADMERYAVSGERTGKAKIRKVALDVKLSKLEKQKEQIMQTKPDWSRCIISCDIMYPVTKVTIGDKTEYVELVQNQYVKRYTGAFGKT